MYLTLKLARLRSEEFLKRCNNEESIGQFVQCLHQQVCLHFFFHPRNRKDFFLNTLTTLQSLDSILEDADDVMNNRFETLGSGKVSLSENINWQCDFKSGKVWKLAPSNTLDILDIDNPSDVKVPWELSRFHQVWWLGKAYWITRNEQYALKFCELVEDWIDKNPPGMGVNWVIAMEVTIRACNWIAGYYFFCDSKSLTSDFWLKFFKSLYIHGFFIYHNLEYSRINGNHFLSNVVGLIFLGILFRDTQFGQRWLRWSVKNLENEMQNQVLPDGVDFEKSTSYHRLVLELFYSAALLCKVNNIGLSQSFWNRLEKMFEFIQYYIRPDGSIPLWGDADDGHLFRFSMNEEINDHRHALAIGAILFNRSDFKVAAGKICQDVLFYFGEEGIEKWQLLNEETKPLSSRVFPDGGFYILHGRNSHLFIDAGELGQRGRGGHGHNDTFSFELWANGEPLIVDSGTYTYTSDVKARQEFRSIRAHNTVVVDNEEIADFNDLWSVKKDRTHPRVLVWTTSELIDVLEMEHNGYQRLPSPVIHQRRFEFNKSELWLTITDMLKGRGFHLIESFLHFAPGIALSIIDHRTIIASSNNVRYRISTSVGEYSIIKSRYSPRYGKQETNKALKIISEDVLPLKQVIIIRPQ